MCLAHFVPRQLNTIIGDVTVATNHRNFRELLEAQWARNNFVCVGLDSQLDKIPESSRIRFSPEGPIDVLNTILAFNRAIVEATGDLVCAYKPNAAFYEPHGVNGINALQRTIALIHDMAPNVPVIYDAKRGDIGNSNLGYIDAAFRSMNADAITVHPYLGAESLQPFLALADKGIFVLCRTSNPGAGEFQDLDVCGDVVPGNYMPFYKYVAHRVSQHWNSHLNCCLVVGATYPNELREVRMLVGDTMPILLPGIGKQGADVKKSVTAGKDSRGAGIIVNSARDIIFASNDANFAEAARSATFKLRDQINQSLSK